MAVQVSSIIELTSALVALGFEHFVANMFLLPLAIIQLLAGFTLGNVVGGGHLVSMAHKLSDGPSEAS